MAHDRGRIGLDRTRSHRCRRGCSRQYRSRSRGRTHRLGTVRRHFRRTGIVTLRTIIGAPTTAAAATATAPATALAATPVTVVLGHRRRHGRTRGLHRRTLFARGALAALLTRGTFLARRALFTRRTFLTRNRGRRIVTARTRGALFTRRTLTALATSRTILARGWCSGIPPTTSTTLLARRTILARSTLLGLRVTTALAAAFTTATSAAILTTAATATFLAATPAAIPAPACTATTALLLDRLLDRTARPAQHTHAERSRAEPQETALALFDGRDHGLGTRQLERLQTLLHRLIERLAFEN
ncbi:MAG: hypothetical protein ABL977_04050 [Candidatus Eisenbacteria bacterium]